MFNVSGIFTNNYRITGLVVILLTFELIVILPFNVMMYEKNDSSLSKKWTVKVFFSLLLVFGPIFLMPILMLLGIKK